MRLDVKVNRGIYRTTELGSLCFNLLEKQARLMLKIESIISSVSSDFCSAHRACLYFLDSFNGHVYVAVVAEAYSAFWAAEGGSNFAAGIAGFPDAFVTQRH
jgi:hypothetical protein